MPVLWLLLGLALGSLLIAYARSRPHAEQRILAVGLLVAAALYVGFAAWAGAGIGWLALEALGVLLYSGFAWLSFRRSPRWLAAGWALHVAWDVGLHLVGPGAALAPPWYPVLCIPFDLLAAGYLVFAFEPRDASPAAA